MKKYLKYTAYSVSPKLLTKKVENKKKEYNDNGYQIESVIYFKNKWLIQTAKCIFFKVGAKCGCHCHLDGRMIHKKPCCDNGFIF